MKADIKVRISFDGDRIVIKKIKDATYIYDKTTCKYSPEKGYTNEDIKKDCCIWKGKNVE